MSQGRNWCFTINNWTDDDINKLSGAECRYMVYGKETGETGTPHLQGFVVFNTAKRLGGVKQLHETAHWELARGTWEQAANYCKKDGDFTERGVAPMSQKRKGEVEIDRWDAAYEAVKAGRFEDVPNDIAGRGGIRNLLHKARLTQKRPEPCEVDCRWYHGRTGTGKSHAARTEFPEYFLKGRTKWWDGYTDQETVVIEEWDPKTSEFIGSYLKEWCDKWPFEAETKGGRTSIRPKRIIVTSNYTLEQCFGHDKCGLLEPLERRFNVVLFQGV